MSNIEKVEAVLFDACKKLVDQDEPAMNESGNCFYRSTNDQGEQLKCFAGHLIADEKYDDAFEGKSANSDRVWPVIQASNPTFADFDATSNPGQITDQLQAAHDLPFGSFSFAECDYQDSLGHDHFGLMFLNRALKIAKSFRFMTLTDELSKLKLEYKEGLKAREVPA